MVGENTVDGEATYFDEQGNLKLRQAMGQDNSDAFDYRYDIDGRLIEDRQQSGGDRMMYYSYDDFGNFIYKDSSTNEYVYHKDGSSDETLNGVVSQIGSDTLGYDNGNVVNGTGRITELHGYNVDYNEVGQVVSITGGPDNTSVSFEYGPYDELVKTNYGNGASIVSWNGMEAVLQEGSVSYIRYSVGEAEVISGGYSAGNYLLYRNYLGSIVSIWKDGQIVNSMDYDAYGSSDLAPESEAWKITRRGFTGHIMVEGTPFIFMNARLYSTELGRFTSIDPVFDGMYRSGGLNGYGYVSGNPYKYWDPTGKNGEESQGFTLSDQLNDDIIRQYNIGAGLSGSYFDTHGFIPQTIQGVTNIILPDDLQLEVFNSENSDLAVSGGGVVTAGFNTAGNQLHVSELAVHLGAGLDPDPSGFGVGIVKFGPELYFFSGSASDLGDLHRNSAVIGLINITWMEDQDNLRGLTISPAFGFGFYPSGPSGSSFVLDLKSSSDPYGYPIQTDGMYMSYPGKD